MDHGDKNLRFSTKWAVLALFRVWVYMHFFKNETIFYLEKWPNEGQSATWIRRYVLFFSGVKNHRDPCRSQMPTLIDLAMTIKFLKMLLYYF